MSYLKSAPAWLAELRATAQDAVNAADHEAVVALVEQLRRDVDFWHTIWAPAVAISLRTLDRPGARELLLEAIDAGFSQPELFELELERAFAAESDWPRLRERMRANIPPAPVSLTDWPRRPHGPEIGWFRLDPDAEDQLRQRIPQPQDSAWDTVVELLRWTAQRWRHANDHVDKPDALDILDKVEAGQRFACVEYATVLAQALNAVSIPARRVQLLTADFHHGLGRGHVATEAWVDDLDSWVLLDPQNGMYWLDADDRPASPLYLHDRLRSGGARPRHVCVATTTVDDDAAETWWRHFRHFTVEGEVSITWDRPFVPTFQNRFTRGVDLIETDPAAIYPDLSASATASLGTETGPALRFTPVHPYATSVTVTDGDTTHELGLAETWPLTDHSPGEHRAGVATRTRYGTLAAQPLEFTVA